MAPHEGCQTLRPVPAGAISRCLPANTDPCFPLFTPGAQPHTGHRVVSDGVLRDVNSAVRTALVAVAARAATGFESDSVLWRAADYLRCRNRLSVEAAGDEFP